MAVLKLKEVEAKLRDVGGNMAAVARSFGVTRQAVWKMVQQHQCLKDVCHDARESMTDHAESSLSRAVINGEAWAVCFYLKTQGKNRGYVERTEQETTLKGDVNVNVSKQPVPPSAAVLAFLDRLGIALPPAAGDGEVRADGGAESVDTARSNGKASHLPPAG